MKLALFLMICFSSLFGRIGPFGMVSHFNDTTYIVVTDPGIISELYKQLSISSYELGDPSKQMQLDVQNTQLRRKLSLHYDSWSGIELIPIIAPQSVLKKTLYLWPGREVYCEFLNKDNTSETIKLEIDQLFLHQTEEGDFVLATCLPHENYPKKNREYYRNFASLNYNQRRIAVDLPEDYRVPQKVNQVYEALQEKLIPSQTRTSPIDRFHSRILPVPFEDYKKQKSTFYVGIFSYGSKGSKGYLVLLNEQAEILFVKPGYRGLAGVVDIDKNGMSEVIAIHNLGDYSTGVEIFTIRQKDSVFYLDSHGKHYPLF